MKLSKSLRLSALLLVLSPLTASAEQVELEDGYVGHTKWLPVIVHRLFPPYLGKHVHLKVVSDVAVETIENEAAPEGELVPIPVPESETAPQATLTPKPVRAAKRSKY